MTSAPEWLAEVGPARAGDAGARERLAEAFAPFVHAALLAQLPHHAAQPRVLLLLRSAISQLGVLPDDADFPRWLLPAVRARAAQLAKELGGREEQGAPQAAVGQARQLLTRLRGLPPPTVEKVLARLVEGVPGPELAALYGEREAEVRAELARGAAALLQAQPGVDLQADSYLWEQRGTPSAAVASLETSLALLRFDGAGEAAPGEALGFTAAELTPISGEKAAPLGEGKRPTGAGFRTVEATEPSGPKAEWEVATSPAPNVPAHPQSDPNPFLSKVSTIAATDLPAAAAVVQAPQPAPRSSRSDAPAQGEPRRSRSDVPAVGPAPRRTGEVPVQRLAVQPAQTLLDAEDDSTQSKTPSVPRRLPEVEDEEGERTAMEPSPRRLPQVEDEEGERTAMEPPPRAGAQARESTRVVAIPTAPRASGKRPAQPGSAPDLTPVSADPRPRLTWGALPFILAGSFALFALLASWSALTLREKQVRQGFQFTSVLVAAQDLPEGTLLDLDQVSTRAVPAQYAGKSTVSPESLKMLLGLKALVPIQAGDPLLYSQFLEQTSQRLKVGKRTRGFTLPTTPRRAVGGMVRPGDRVDVLLTITDPQRGQKEASTLIQNVLVLAVADVAQFTRVGSGKDRKATTNVTVAVIPEEAEALALAKDLGQVTLSLRNDEDNETMDPGRLTNIATLLLGEGRAKAIAQRRAAIVQTLRAGSDAK